MADYALKDIARFQSVLELQTTVADGTHEVFVDSPAVPQGSFGVLTCVDIGPFPFLTTALGVFHCDSTMRVNQSPLLADGSLDPSKIGPAITGFGFIPSGILGGGLPFPLAILAPGDFIRFSTYNAPAIFQAPGNVATVRMAISFIPFCEGS